MSDEDWRRFVAVGGLRQFEEPFMPAIVPNEEPVKCAIHDVVEPFVAGESISCFECAHSYPNAAELLAAWREFVADRDRTLEATGFHRKQIVPDITDANDVPFCPLCLHDW